MRYITPEALNTKRPLSTIRGMNKMAEIAFDVQHQQIQIPCSTPLAYESDE